MTSAAFVGDGFDAAGRPALVAAWTGANLFNVVVLRSTPAVRTIAGASIFVTARNSTSASLINANNLCPTPAAFSTDGFGAAGTPAFVNGRASTGAVLFKIIG